MIRNATLFIVILIFTQCATQKPVTIVTDNFRSDSTAYYLYDSYETVDQMPELIGGFATLL